MYRQVAIIARTNLGLFEEMAKVVRTLEGKKKKLGFVGVRRWLIIIILSCMMGEISMKDMNARL